MPAHLRPPERRSTRPFGVLAIAIGIALLVTAAVSGGPDDEPTTQLVQPAAEATDPTVLGEQIERTTVPAAPPASAAGFTTTTADRGSGSSDGDGDGDEGQPVVRRPSSPPPTIGPPVSIIRPPTTTTTAPTTTTTEEPTTTTESTTTTTEAP